MSQGQEGFVKLIAEALELKLPLDIIFTEGEKIGWERDLGGGGGLYMK